jgi:chromosome segregation ATPase
MSNAHGQDQFTTVANRRAGYTEPVEWALKIAKRGGTLAAGEGLLLVEHYESRLAAVEHDFEQAMAVAKQNEETARTLSDRLAAVERERDYITGQYNIVRSMLTEQVPIMNQMDDALAAVELERDQIMTQLSDYTQEVLALREQQERERALTVAERAMVEAAEAWADWRGADGSDPMPTDLALVDAVRAMREAR